MSQKHAIDQLSKVSFHSREEWDGSHSVRIHNKIVVVKGIPKTIADEISANLNLVLTNARQNLLGGNRFEAVMQHTLFQDYQQCKQ